MAPILRKCLLNVPFDALQESISEHISNDMSQKPQLTSKKRNSLAHKNEKC